MALVTGTLIDFGLAALASFSPEIVFTASGPAVTSGKLLATRPIVSVPAVSGTFTVNLAPTDDMHPATWYTITIQWLNSDGGYVSKDFPDWRLYVPSGGGNISDLLQVPSNPAMVWVGLTPPPNPTPGTWWLETNPDNFDDPANTGELYEWSN